MLKLSHLLTDFLDVKDGDITENKLNDYEFTGLQMIEILGDVEVDSINFESIKLIKSKLSKLPKRNIQAYKIMPLKKYMKQRAKVPKDKITITTMNKKLTILGQMLKYYQEDLGNYDYNVPLIRKFKDKESARLKRRAFDKDQVKELTTGEDLENSIARVFFYSGARPSEIPKGVFKDINGVDCLSLSYDDIKEGEILKTDASYRLIPIHSKITKDVDIVLEYLKNNRLDSLSKRFNRWLRRKGYGVKYSLYSFRHSFIDALKNEEDIKDSIVKALAGHADGTPTFGIYGSDFDPKPLKNAIEKIK